MKITLEREIESCRECFHVTNSSQLHDCAFTSAPFPTRWYCSHGRELILLHDENQISVECPLKGVL